MRVLQRVRIMILAATLGCALFALERTIVAPKSLVSRFAPYTFPQNVPLEGWLSMDSERLTIPGGRSRRLIDARRYRYKQGSIALEVEVRYFADTDGDVANLIRGEAGEPSSLEVGSLPGVGQYAFVMQEGRAGLAACINPRGGSTVTEQQFRQNRDIYERDFSRFGPWLLGLRPLHDRRCLLTFLTIPVERLSREEALRILEPAWQAWHAWWVHHFPEP